MADPGETWLNAIRGIKDNPVYLYLRLARRRELRRAGWLRRNWLIVLILALEAVGAGFYIFLNAADYQWDWHALLQPTTWEALGYIILLPLYGVWFCQGLFQAVLDALLVLAPAGRRLRLLVLDDLCATTLLTDRELAVGLLANLLPPLFWRIIAGAGLCTAFAINNAYHNSITSVYIDPAPVVAFTKFAWQDVLLAPVAYVIVLIISSLGTLALLLLMLALSRGMRPVLASCAAVLMVFMQVQYILVAVAMLPSAGYGIELAGGNLVFAALGLAGVPVLLLCVLSLSVYLSRINRSFRLFFAAGAPVIAAVVPYLVYTCFALLIPIFAPIVFGPDWTGAFIQSSVVSYLYSIGALSTLSPLGITEILSFGTGAVLSISDVMLNIALLPLLIALQLALIWVFAKEALIAIRLRRHGVE